MEAVILTKHVGAGLNFENDCFGEEFESISNFLHLNRLQFLTFQTRLAYKRFINYMVNSIIKNVYNSIHERK